MLLTNLVREYQLLLSEGILSEQEARECMAQAASASFLNRFCPL